MRLAESSIILVGDEGRKTPARERASASCMVSGLLARSGSLETPLKGSSRFRPSSSATDSASVSLRSCSSSSEASSNSLSRRESVMDEAEAVDVCNEQAAESLVSLSSAAEAIENSAS